MKRFNIRIFDPPKQFESGEAPKTGAPMRDAPIAALFRSEGALTEICRLYGYLMLLGHNLEFELRECLSDMKFAFAVRGIKARFTGNPKKAMFRNYLAHEFFSTAGNLYYITPGGQQAIIHRLKLAEKTFFPLIMVISHIGRGYMSDYGVTDEYVKRRRKAWEEEQRQLESELKQIFNDEDE